MKNAKRFLTLSIVLILVSLMIVFAKTQIRMEGVQTFASDMPPIITAATEDDTLLASDMPPIITAATEDDTLLASDMPPIITA